MVKELIKRAVVLFPRADYLNPATVRHNRRRYINSVIYLRKRNKWILDQKVQRVSGVVISYHPFLIDDSKT